MKLAKRQFAVQENGVEQIELGGLKDASVGPMNESSHRYLVLIQGTEILQSMETQEEPKNALKKKEKQQLKREAFLDSPLISSMSQKAVLILTRASSDPLSILKNSKTSV